MAFGNVPLLAVIVIGYEPTVPAAGVPLKTPAALKVTPVGKAPVSVNVGAGEPDAATVKVFAAPTLKVAVAALVNAGATGAVYVTLT